MLTIDLDQLGLARGQVCLDVGCGQGRHTLATYLLEGVFALGLDLSAEDLATARGRITDMQPHSPGGQIGFATGDATALPLADETVDVQHARQEVGRALVAAYTARDRDTVPDELL